MYFQPRSQQKKYVNQDLYLQHNTVYYFSFGLIWTGVTVLQKCHQAVNLIQKPRQKFNRLS